MGMIDFYCGCVYDISEYEIQQPVDCANVPGGSATTDDCNTCVEGNTGKTTQIWYKDNDTWGNSSNTKSCYNPGSGWVTRGGDVNDNCYNLANEAEQCPCLTTKEDLKNLFPNAPDATLEKLKDILNKHMEDYGIDTKEKLQHFLAQAGHESGGFNNLGVTENMNYSVSGLLNTWPTRFSQTDPNKEDPDEYANNPSKIGNFVYGRPELGNTSPGDGYKFRGRGIFQLTGKSNYQAFQNFYNNKYDPNIDLISNPNLLVSDNNLAVLSALWFFQNKVINKVSVNANTSVENVTRKINGRTIGLPDRQAKYNSAKQKIDCN